MNVSQEWVEWSADPAVVELTDGTRVDIDPGDTMLVDITDEDEIVGIHQVKRRVLN